MKKYNIKIGHRPTKTLRNDLSHLKDKPSNFQKAGVVYKLKCQNCPKIYIGETGRQVRDRMYEHEADIRKKKPLSKVYAHTAATGHSFSFDNVSVLDTCQDSRVRRQLEGIYTHINQNSINRAIDFNPIYEPAVSSLKI